MSSANGNLADQLGIRLRGAQNNIAKALRQFQPGGHTGTGQQIPVIGRLPFRTVGNQLGRLPFRTVSTTASKPLAGFRPITSATPGKMAAPHPRTTTTEFALSRGFRSIRKGQ